MRPRLSPIQPPKPSWLSFYFIACCPLLWPGLAHAGDEAFERLKSIEMGQPGMAQISQAAQRALGSLDGTYHLLAVAGSEKRPYDGFVPAICGESRAYFRHVAGIDDAIVALFFGPPFAPDFGSLGGTLSALLPMGAMPGENEPHIVDFLLTSEQPTFGQRVLTAFDTAFVPHAFAVSYGGERDRFLVYIRPDFFPKELVEPLLAAFASARDSAYVLRCPLVEPDPMLRMAP